MNHTLRIACTGSSFGGKSTLAEALSNELQLTPITYSRPTAAANVLGYAAAREVKEQDQVAFQLQGFLEQVKAESFALGKSEHLGAHVWPATAGRGFVADRTVECFLAHFRAQTSFIDQGRLPEYDRLVKAHAQQAYDCIIYMPAFRLQVVEDNGIRNLGNFEAVETHLLDQLERHGLMDKVLMLKSDGPENRVREVMAWLAERGLITPFKAAGYKAA